MPWLSVDARSARARSAISLGAACAIFGVALLGYETPASQAAGGLIEAVFGGPRVATELYYGYLPRYDVFRAPPRRLRYAKRPRDAQARRRVVERRPLAMRSPARPVEQRRPAVVDMIPAGRATVLSVWRPAQIAVMRPERRELRTLPAPQPRLRPEEPALAIALVQGRMAETAPFYADRTLRPGDTVVTPQGVRILRAGSHYPFRETDFLTLAEAGAAPLANRSALNEIERALKTPPGRAPGDL